MMNDTLRLIKNYIDAKIAYEIIVVSTKPRMLSPSLSLTPTGQEVLDRYINAETELNLAIEGKKS